MSIMSGSGSIDIFQMLFKESKRRREKRAELLKSIGVKEFFKYGKIEINHKICQGIECKLCVKACPTNALYWSYGRVNVVEDLCVYCAACVLSCIVDNCIMVTRKRADGKTEVFSTPREAARILRDISSRRRINLVSRVFQQR
jgi:ferredoxin